jgi:hypothetical protein
MCIFFLLWQMYLTVEADMDNSKDSESFLYVFINGIAAF